MVNVPPRWPVFFVDFLPLLPQPAATKVNAARARANHFQRRISQPPGCTDLATYSNARGAPMLTAGGRRGGGLRSLYGRGSRKSRPPRHPGPGAGAPEEVLSLGTWKGEER